MNSKLLSKISEILKYLLRSILAMMIEKRYKFSLIIKEV
jgi:hypothetical protein